MARRISFRGNPATRRVREASRFRRPRERRFENRVFGERRKFHRPREIASDRRFFGRESTQSEPEEAFYHASEVFYNVYEAGKTIYKAPEVLPDVYVAIRSQNNPVVIR